MYVVSDVYCGVGWLIFCIAVSGGGGRIVHLGLDVGIRVAIGVKGCPLRDDVRTGVIQVGRWDWSHWCRRLDIEVHREIRSEDGAVGISAMIEVIEIFLL
jgi:hypothetical protein